MFGLLFLLGVNSKDILYYGTSSYTDYGMGWRPVLELIK